MNKENKVLIIDDDDNTLSALNRVLIDEPYKVLCVNNPIEALQNLSEFKPGVIISDLKMPKVNGIQFLSYAKNICPNSIRIMLSAFSEKEDVINAVQDGKIWKYVLKPWNDTELKELINSAFQLFKEKKAAQKSDEGINAGKKIFFLYPPKDFRENIIIDLICASYECYYIDDCREARRLFKKHNQSLIFINIDHPLSDLKWEEYIKDLMKNEATKGNLIGVLSYKTNPELKELYLMDLSIQCGFIQLKAGLAHSKEMILKVLEANEAKGRRQAVRLTIENEFEAVLNIKLHGRIYDGKIVDISTVAVACILKKQPKLEVGSAIDSIQLKIKGVVVQISGVVKYKRIQNGDFLFIIMFDNESIHKNEKKIARFISAGLNKKIKNELYLVKR